MKLFQWTLLAALALGALVVPMSVSAQDVAAEPEVMPTEEEDVAAFWAERRRVRVLQRRLFEKDDRLSVSLFAGAIPNDAFVHYFPVGLRLNYYLTESVGFELSGSYIGDTFRSTTELGSFLDERVPTSAGVEVFVLDQQRWRSTLAATWSPIYGKISFIGQKLIHFDWGLSAGVGVVGTQSVDENRGTEMVNEIKPEVALGTGLNIWFSEHWGMRIDYRQFVFQKAGGGVTTPSEISLAATFFL